MQGVLQVEAGPMHSKGVNPGFGRDEMSELVAHIRLGQYCLYMVYRAVMDRTFGISIY